MIKTTVKDPIMEEFVQKIKQIPEVKKVILYGSRARGDFEEWSDYDIIVLVSIKNKNIESQIDNTAWNINYKRLVSIVPVICTESKFRKEKYEPLFMNIRREGIIL
jgi:predicted nucleotidyltransferase